MIMTRAKFHMQSPVQSISVLPFIASLHSERGRMHMFFSINYIFESRSDMTFCLRWRCPLVSISQAAQMAWVTFSQAA